MTGLSAVAMSAAGSLGLSLALLAAPATSSATGTVVQTGDLTPAMMRETRKRDARLARLCRSALHHRDAPGHLKADADTLSDVAARLWHGEGGCRKNPTLAIDLLRLAVGGRPLQADVDMVARLADYLAENGAPGDRAELTDLEAIMWVRGDSYRAGMAMPLTAEEKRAFVARDDIWAFLSAPDAKISWSGREARIDALLDPLSPRYAPGEGVAALEAGLHAEQWVRAARVLLDGREVARDGLRAERLLLKAAPYADAARLMLAPMLGDQLASVDRAVRNAAVAQFAPWSRLDGAGAAAIRRALFAHYRAQLAAPAQRDRHDAVAALTSYALAYPDIDPSATLAWADAALRRGDDADKALGWRTLVAFVDAKTPGAETMLAGALARAGGVVDGGALGIEDVRGRIVDADYPARALREKREGVVESEAIFAPDGRALMVTITRASEPDLGNEVRKVMMRRLRLKAELSVAGRHVRFTLPPIQFRIRPCPGKDEITPAIEGALLVDGQCIERPNLVY